MWHILFEQSKIIVKSFYPDNWCEEDTEEMLVMMENALVKAEDDDERINVVQEIGSVMQVFIIISMLTEVKIPPIKEKEQHDDDHDHDHSGK